MAIIKINYTEEYVFLSKYTEYVIHQQSISFNVSLITFNLVYWVAKYHVEKGGLKKSLF